MLEIETFLPNTKYFAITATKPKATTGSALTKGNAMAFVKITPKSTKFLDELRKRQASFRGARIAARIQVPSDLSFWYFLEFGTASRQDSAAPIRGPGTSYPIYPVDANALSWPGPDGERIVRDKVLAHPGIRPHPFVRQTLPDIRSFAKADLIAALMGAGGFRTANVKAQLLGNTMHRIVEMLSASLASAAPGTREDGKLDGNTAAEVFEEEAEVVDSSSHVVSASSKGSPTQPPRTSAPRAPRPQLRPNEKALLNLRRAATQLSNTR